MESALSDDIKKHGSNAYYYAHAQNLGPTTIRAYDEPPRLLSSAPVTTTKAPAVRETSVSSYAWSDCGHSVKIYVDFSDLEAMDTEAVQVLHPTPNSVELRVAYSDSHHVLRLGPLCEAFASTTVKKTAKRVVVTLLKTEEGKARTWWDLLSTNKPSAAGSADIPEDDFTLPGDSRFGASSGDLGDTDLGGLGGLSDLAGLSGLGGMPGEAE